jgi:hypothetical protein
MMAVQPKEENERSYDDTYYGAGERLHGGRKQQEMDAIRMIHITELSACILNE